MFSAAHRLGELGPRPSPRPRIATQAHEWASKPTTLVPPTIAMRAVRADRASCIIADHIRRPRYQASPEVPRGIFHVFSFTSRYARRPEQIFWAARNLPLHHSDRWLAHTTAHSISVHDKSSLAEGISHIGDTPTVTLSIEEAKRSKPATGKTTNCASPFRLRAFPRAAPHSWVRAQRRATREKLWWAMAPLAALGIGAAIVAWGAPSHAAIHGGKLRAFMAETIEESTSPRRLGMTFHPQLMRVKSS